MCAFRSDEESSGEGAFIPHPHFFTVTHKVVLYCLSSPKSDQGTQQITSLVTAKVDRLGEMREKNHRTSWIIPHLHWLKDNFVQTGMTSNAITERMHRRIIILKVKKKKYLALLGKELDKGREIMTCLKGSWGRVLYAELIFQLPGFPPSAFSVLFVWLVFKVWKGS